MNVSGARELFRGLTKEFFPQYTVVFSNQSRTPKPNIPLVTILPGNAKRHRSPNEFYDQPEAEGYYQTKLSFTVDLFTNGAPVYDDDTGEKIANENTATDEMLLFANYLNSIHVTKWCNRNDVSIVMDGDVQDLTGLVNDTTYEFRSRLVVNFYFTQNTEGEKATPAPSSEPKP